MPRFDTPMTDGWRGKAARPARNVVWTQAMPDTPLRPDELETYKTDVQTDDVAREHPAPTPGTDSRPWIVVGVVALGVFVLLIVLALGQVLA
jgi:hypothetical protein